MPRRTLTQIIYGSVFLLLVLGVGFWFYRGTLPAPSCTNGVQDYNEQGLDCGGVCPNACVPATLSALQAGEIKIFHSAPGKVGVLAQFQNPNPAWGADSAAYSLKLLDVSGNLLTTLTGQTFVYAAQIKYLADFWQDPRADQVASAELDLSSPHWLPAASFSPPQIKVQSQSAVPNGNLVQVSGKVASTDTITLRDVSVIAVLYDKYGLMQGVTRTTLADLPAGEAEDFALLHPAFQGLDVNRVNVLTYARRPAF